MLQDENELQKMEKDSEESKLGVKSYQQRVAENQRYVDSRIAHRISTNLLHRAHSCEEAMSLSSDIFPR